MISGLKGKDYHFGKIGIEKHILKKKYDKDVILKNNKIIKKENIKNTNNENKTSQNFSPILSNDRNHMYYSYNIQGNKFFFPEILKKTSCMPYFNYSISNKIKQMDNISSTTASFYNSNRSKNLSATNLLAINNKNKSFEEVENEHILLNQKLMNWKKILEKENEKPPQEEIETIKIKSLSSKKKLILSNSAKNINPQSYLTLKRTIFTNPQIRPQSPKTQNAQLKNNNITNSSSTTINNTKIKDESSSVKSYKTSNDFFSKEKSNPSIIKNLIKRVLENNKKQEEPQNKEFLHDIGNYFANFQMKRSANNFYKTSRSQNKKHNFNEPKNSFPKVTNFYEISISNILEWKKHEELWNNLPSIVSLSDSISKYLFPPNSYDVLTSKYLLMFSKYLNIDLPSNYEIKNDNKNVKMTIKLDDKIKNPHLEIKKWKAAYKKVILQWHPDKLSSKLKDITCVDESQKRLLLKKTAHIINNMNNLYKKIVEILKQIPE